MVQEFIEVDDAGTFRLVAEHAPLVIRRDPYLFAQYFSAMVYINMAKLDEREVKKLFDLLRGKMIIVKSLVKASSISDFLEKVGKEGEGQGT
ncbi:MAG: hypothetical protein QXJ19_03685 [Candidatus Bathyarchaeia archaeon]|nr:hypothetical protein [Candidatus Bathyarchaeota archaeon]